MIDWQPVYETDSSYRAEIVRARLNDLGIEAVILNKKDSNYHFGFFEIMVQPDFVMKALQAIERDIKFE